MGIVQTWSAAARRTLSAFGLINSMLDAMVVSLLMSLNGLGASSRAINQKRDATGHARKLAAMSMTVFDSVMVTKCEVTLDEYYTAAVQLGYIG